MSNKFKPNSRFAALADEIKETKQDNMKKQNTKGHKDNARNQENTKTQDNTKTQENTKTQDKTTEDNIFKRAQPVYDRPRRTFDNRNSKEQMERRLKEEQTRKDKEKERENVEKLKNLNPENFPDLTINITEKQHTPEPSMNNSDKLKWVTVKKENVPKNLEVEVDLEYESLKPGWALAKKDLKTGKIITKYKPSLTPKPRERSEQEIGLDIINALVELHKKRTEEYIDMWGYDTWEKMYRFPNYDYEYFDKLDELYEERENADTDYDSDNDSYY